MPQVNPSPCFQFWRHTGHGSCIGTRHVGDASRAHILLRYHVDLRLSRKCEILATILLVDDDPKILRPLQLLVEIEGYRVLTARDGEAALVATVTQHPNLIVTDWMMPRVDGIELCRRLRNDSATADIPVVMLSAAQPPPQTERLWDVLLLKPTPINALMKVIRSLLEHTQSDARSRF